MNWKVMFLAILLLFGFAVTICVTTPSANIPATFGAGFCEFDPDESGPLRFMDDGPGG